MLFPAIGRTLWAVPICFMIVAGSTEYKNGKPRRHRLELLFNYFCVSPGLITRILNAKILLPFSRMTFSAYLLNPLVVLLVTMSSELSFHLDFYTIVIFTIGFYFVTYLAAFVFMILFENPIIMFIRKFAE